MTRTGFLLVAAVCCCAAVTSSSAGDRGRPNSAAPGPGAAAGAIHNRVLDLLADEVVLDIGDTDAAWESEPFATDRFNRIGLRAAVAEDSLPVRCQVCWKFADDDACLDGMPLVHAPVLPTPGDDLPRPQPTPPARLEALGFSPVYGLSARVRCRIPDVVFIGDDPDAPDATTATLTDVKVLLRRE